MTVPENPYVVRIEQENERLREEVKELHDENQRFREENRKQFDTILIGQQTITQHQNRYSELEKLYRSVINNKSM